MGVRPIVGAELTLDNGALLRVLIGNRAGYQNLCCLTTPANLRGTKQCALEQWSELEEWRVSFDFGSNFQIVMRVDTTADVTVGQMLWDRIATA